MVHDRSRELLIAILSIAVVGLLALPVNAAVEVHGRNMGLGQVDNLKNTVGSLNWGGYVAANSLTSPTAAVTQVTASWIVQPAAKTSTATYSAQWTGIGGFFSSDQTLIQLGTESDYYRNAAHYYAWIEMLPSSEQVISLSVKPGDTIVASISPATNPVSNSWLMTMTDVTTGMSFTSPTETYKSSMLSGEYIEERPALCNAFTCTLTTLANFGTADFGYYYTKQSGTEYLTVGGVIGALGSTSNGWTNENVIMYANNGRTQIAIPSGLSADGTSFTMTYHATTGGSGFGGPAGHPEKWGISRNTVEDAPGPLDHHVH